MERASGGRGEAGGEPTLKQIVFDDLRRGDVRRSLGQDLKDLYSFYLTEERREQLATMGTVRRIFWFWGWLVKSLLAKLSPARRLLLLAAFLLLIWGEGRLQMGTVELVVYTRLIGIGLMVLVLMLELKDKLLVRDEIEIAREVQLALLPRRHPQREGWSIWGQTRPANDVGGDLIDYVVVGGGRLGIVLGDVAGKGLGAALLMARLQAILRATAPEIRDLTHLGFRLNEILLRDGIDNRYATLFFMLLDPATGRISYLNAGHNPPIVLRDGGMERLEANGPPLGMMPDARFSDRETRLAPGDLLFVYSDGLPEARNAQDDEFGTERLAALLPGLRGLQAEDAAHRVLSRAEAFMGGARPHDDISVIVVSRNGAR